MKLDIVPVPISRPDQQNIVPVPLSLHLVHGGDPFRCCFFHVELLWGED